ncbi:MAG: hypothetical protein Q4D61_06900 [Cardiobacteriaceae bacterium]|nr:hypothetical protein [Cardiobacteriaceae bacterium]
MKKTTLLALILASHATLADDAISCDRLRSPLDGNAHPIHYHPDAILPALRDACLDALKADPGNPRLLYQTGMAYHFLGAQEELTHHSKGMKASRAERLREHARVQTPRSYLQRAADAGYFPARLQLASFPSALNEGSKASLDALLAAAQNDEETRAVHLLLGHWYATHAMHDRANADAHRTAMRSHYQKAADLGMREALVFAAKADTDLVAADKALRDLAAEGDLLALQSLGEWQASRKDDAGLAQTVAELERLGADNPDYRITAQYLRGMALVSHGQNDADRKQGMQNLQEAAAAGHTGAKAITTFNLPAQP